MPQRPFFKGRTGVNRQVEGAGRDLFARPLAFEVRDAQTELSGLEFEATACEHLPALLENREIASLPGDPIPDEPLAPEMCAPAGIGDAPLGPGEGG